METHWLIGVRNNMTEEEMSVYAGSKISSSV